MINIITIFIFLLVIGLSINTVRAGENYNSSKSNTATSIGIINQDVGNLLINYGYGGEVVNRVTEALAVGVTTDGLRIILGGTSARSPAVVEEVLQKLEVELERLGIRDTPQSAPATGTIIIKDKNDGEISTPGTGDTPQPATINQELHRPPTSATTPQQPLVGTGEQRFKDIQGLDSETRSGGFIKLGDLPGKRAAFGDSAQKSIQDLKAAGSDDQLKGKVRHELQANRETLRKSAETLRQNLRENAQDLRDNFRTEYLKYELKDVRVVSFRIAVAHGKGLRMINRYRSAIARFDHILGRLESRIEKIGIENEAQARAKGIVIEKNYLPAAILLIEEAKNTQALNKAKLVELEAKYESLLTGENPQRVAEEARAIAKELKTEIEKLRGLLDDIRQSTGTINTTKSNTF